MWRRFVHDATGGSVRGRFLRPSEVREIDVDPTTGALALAGCPARQPEVFLIGTEPEETCPSWARRPGRRDRGVIERLFERWLNRL